MILLKIIIFIQSVLNTKWELNYNMNVGTEVEGLRRRFYKKLIILKKHNKRYPEVFLKNIIEGYSYYNEITRKIVLLLDKYDNLCRNSILELLLLELSKNNGSHLPRYLEIGDEIRIRIIGGHEKHTLSGAMENYERIKMQIEDIVEYIDNELKELKNIETIYGLRNMKRYSDLLSKKSYLLVLNAHSDFKALYFFLMIHVSQCKTIQEP